MANAFTIHSKGPAGGDGTAPYEVNLINNPSVAMFTEQVMNNIGDWGVITIRRGLGHKDDVSVGYRYGSLTKHMDDKILKKTIKRASASGGWSRMDYVLWI